MDVTIRSYRKSLVADTLPVALSRVQTRAIPNASSLLSIKISSANAFLRTLRKGEAGLMRDPNSPSSRSVQSTPPIEFPLPESPISKEQPESLKLNDGSVQCCCRAGMAGKDCCRGGNELARPGREHLWSSFVLCWRCRRQM